MLITTQNVSHQNMILPHPSTYYGRASKTHVRNKLIPMSPTRCSLLDSASPGSTEVSADSCAYQKVQRTHSDKDMGRFKTLQKETQRQCKTAYDSYVWDLVTSDGKSLKKLWSFIKGNKCDSGCVSPLKKGGIAYSDAKVKASILNQQFTSV